MNQISSVTDPLFRNIVFNYDFAGRLTRQMLPDGREINYLYDANGNVTSITPPSRPNHSFTYTPVDLESGYYPPSPLAGEGGERGEKYTYSYDSIYRLLQSMPIKLQGKDKELENKAEIFTYDSVGNRLTGTKDKLNYNYNQGNQLTELIREKRDDDEKKVEYTYDKNGNLTKKVELDDDGKIKKATLHSYDYENRLTKVEIQKKDKVKIVSFTYDPFGRRLSKVVHREEIMDASLNW